MDIEIAGKKIGNNNPTFIVAEIGSNHNQDIGIAMELIEKSIEAGADAVKFQSFTINNWLSKDFNKFPTMEKTEDLRSLLKKAELPYDMYAEISQYCKKRGIICFSSPAHRDDIDRLVKVGVPALKFGGVQITDIPTIEYAATKKIPLIFSDGASELSEVLNAIERAIDAGADQIAILHCISLYPIRDYTKINLNVIRSLRNLFQFPIGYSDHSTDPVTLPVAAVALGASIIEKHITLDRRMPGPDHHFALEPKEFRCMVESIRKTEQALGCGYRRILPDEREIAQMGRRSLVTAKNIKKGDIIKKDDLTIKRPGTGIAPQYLNLVIGRIAKCDISSDRVISWDMI